MCLNPRLIENPKYKANKKNGGVIPPVSDDRVKYVPIGCQECMECRKKKAREWQVRLLEDIKHNKNGKFVTLTFSNESIRKLMEHIRLTEEKEGRIERLKGYDLDNEIATVAVRRFLERWRKKYKISVRHWFVTELGHSGTENIHLHGIIWTNVSNENIISLWKYGHVWTGKEENGKMINYVNERTVNYITKYVTKMDLDHRYYKAKILTSSGIGNGYTKYNGNSKSNKYKGEQTTEHYRTTSGHKIALPIYWRNKIYSEQEREKLWIQKLDKQIRWVGGEKVDISKGEEEYYKLLKYYQKKSKQLGYGDGNTDWERKIYERERRIMMQKTRLKAKQKETNKKDTSFLK